MSDTTNTESTIFDAESVTADLLGADGVYVSTQGLQKVAKVVNTPESTEEGTKLPVPNAGFVHILVFTIGGVSSRVNVPLKATAEGNDDYTVDGKLVGYFEAK